VNRVLTALFAVPLLLALILVAPAWAFSLVVGLAALLGFWELSRIGAAMGMAPFALVGYPACAAMVMLFVPWGEPQSGRLDWAPIAWLAGVAWLGALSAIVSRESPSRERVARLGFTIFGTLYVGLVGFLVGLRYTGGDLEGRRWVVFLLLVVMMSDTGAYYTGKNLGRRKLAPNLSPKKTVEGLIGGVAAGVLAALCFDRLVPTGQSVGALVGVALGLTLVGVSGDLFESFLKRAAGVKDASALIPGHGGVLDRLDSILLAAPALWVFLQL